MNATIKKRLPALIEEINRYKWIESEKAGCDIGMERAVREWMTRHYAGWLRAKYKHRRQRRY